MSCLPIIAQAKATPVWRLLKVTRLGAHDRGRSLMSTDALLRYIITQNDCQLCTESDTAAGARPGHTYGISWAASSLSFPVQGRSYVEARGGMASSLYDRLKMA